MSVKLHFAKRKQIAFVAAQLGIHFFQVNTARYEEEKKNDDDDVDTHYDDSDEDDDDVSCRLTGSIPKGKG